MCWYKVIIHIGLVECRLNRT